MDKKQLTLGSLFSGSGGFELGGILAGIEPKWSSEIAPFPALVTHKRLPNVKHYGNVCSLNGAELEPVDIMTWGSPCQGLSQAGLRKGLADERSGLYVEAVRIVKEMLDATNREYPKYCVFENVPGLLSSTGGKDFLACMDMMQNLGFIPDIDLLDSQNMGVPQRRKRVYITWLNVDYILKKRTNISDSIMLQLLTELSLLNLGVLSKVSADVQKNLKSQDVSRFVDGLKRRIELFSLQKADRLQMLQNSLNEIQATCLNAHISSDLYLGEDPMEDIRADMDTVSEVSKMVSRSWNIGQLLKSVLNESLDLMKLSTISTLTKETTIQKIFTCFQALRSTLLVTIHLSQSLEKTPMFLNCYEWVSYTLTEIGGYINAQQNNLKGIEKLEWNDLLRFYKQEFSRIQDLAQRYITDRCEQEILPIAEGVSGYTPEGFLTWQRTAGGAEESSGETGGRYCINTQGQSGVSVTVDHAGTLVAQDHGNHPAVLHAAGFSTEHSAKARSIGYEEEISPTLRAGVVPAAIGLYENHGMDSRFRGPLKVAQPVTATYGMGGNNQPFVVEDAECYDVRFTSEGTKNARQNCYKTNTARTIDTGGNAPDSNQGGVAVLEPKAYGICSKHSNAMLSDNPHSGFYEADTSRTIDTSDQSPNKNQGGICVISPETYSLQGSVIGRSDENGPQGDGINEDVCFTLNTADRHAVAAPDPSYTISRDNHFAVSEDVSVTAMAKGPATVAVPTDHYCTSKNSHHTVAAHEQANTLVASDWKDPPLVNDTPNDEPVYIVRRLTPVECARLQGFPDWWCADLAIPNPSDEEIAFWTEVWDTWRQVTNPKGKPKTEKQIRKWLADPYTDSAEYKLWGNGVALPCVYFVLCGIAWAAQNSKNHAANCEQSDTKLLP